MSAVLESQDFGSEGMGVELLARHPEAGQLLTPAALAFLAGLHRRFEPARQARLAARRERQAVFDAGGLPDFRADTAAIRAGDWRVRRTAGGPARPPRRNHRAHRSQDGDQRAQLGRQLLHGRLRGFDVADLGQPHHRPMRAARSGRRHAGVHRARGGWTRRQALRPQALRAAGRAAGAPARLAPRREACARRWRAPVGVAVRSGPVRLPQRGRARCEGSRTLLLSAQAPVDGRSAAVERRARLHRKRAAPRRRASSRSPC